MHELGLIQDALQSAVDIAREAGAPRVEQITFVISDRGHLTSDTVRDLFQALSVGTIAQGADVSIEVRPRVRRCHVCKAATPPRERDADCAACGSPLLPFGPEPEIILESISIQESSEADPCA